MFHRTIYDEPTSRVPAPGDVVFYVKPIDGRPVVVALRVVAAFLEPSPGRFLDEPAHWRICAASAAGGAVDLPVREIQLTREDAHAERKRWRARRRR